MLSIAFATVLASSGPVVTQPAHPQPLAEIHYRPDGTDAKLIGLPLSLNGGRPVWFCFDSGAPSTVIDTRLAALTHLAPLRKSIIHGTGHGAVAAEEMEPLTLRLAGVSVRIERPLVIALKDVPINKDDRGLLGSELLAHYIVRIDPVKRTLALFDPATRLITGNATILPLTGDGRRFYLDATLDVKTGLSVTHRLRIDTGSEDSIDDPIVRQSTTLHTTTLGNGLGKNFQGYSGVYDAVHLGPYTLHHVWGPSGDLPAIGMEMLRRFVVTFDVPHGQLLLAPTPALSEPIPAPANG